MSASLSSGYSASESVGYTDYREAHHSKDALRASAHPTDSMNLIQIRPFARPTTGKIAVKVINHYGDEVLRGFGFS